MGWRTVVITGQAKLDLRLEYLVVRKTEATSKIHVSELDMLIVESTQVSMTAALLCELVKNKVKVVFCDETHNPISELMPYYGSYDTSEKLRRQVAWSTDTKALAWTEIISEKIRKQAEHLRERKLFESADMLLQYVSEIEIGDVTNREGHAAKVYFNSLYGKDFSRNDESSINAALNYGYGIILACFTREVVACGYITQLGIFHDNMFNQFNLACDLMEPFRILVDRLVYDMKPTKFEHDEKMEVLHILESSVHIDGKMQYLGNAIKIYCRSVFDALNEGDSELIKFYRNEL